MVGSSSLIHLEDILGAFLAGVVVNPVLARSPVREKLILMSEWLFIPIFFIPIFFIAIGVRLDLPAIAATLLIGKLLVVRQTFGYDWSVSMTMWSLSLPQVAATLAVPTD